jgi:DNA-binding response OmpR family regulator
LPELNARIQAVKRRQKFEGNTTISFDAIQIDTLAQKGYRKNELESIFTSKEYDLLIYFIDNKNRVVSKSSIAEHL